MTDRCAVLRCRGEMAIVYLDHGVCDDCWNRFTAVDAPAHALRMVLGIEVEAPTALEEPMAKKKQIETPDAVEVAAVPDTKPTAVAAAPKKTRANKPKPVDEPPMAKPKPAPKKRTSKPKAAAAAMEATPKPAPKPKKEKPPKEDLVVFACRVAEHERVKFHEATGPGGASRFARRLMVAFANEDEAGFRALLKDAREAR